MAISFEELNLTNKINNHMAMINIFYRISDAGFNKIKPNYINNEQCLANALSVFPTDTCNWRIFADNVSSNTKEMIENYISPKYVEYVSIGHGAGTFNVALDNALKHGPTDIAYFIENDYLHKKESLKIINEGFQLQPSFVSLYDHPDKYISPEQGGNPFCQGGAEDTRVFITKSCHWKITNSTTMTFAAQVSTLKKIKDTLRKHTSGDYPYDFQMFLELRKKGHGLITSIPGYSTHGETAWLTPLTDWANV